jgi:small-conductance mechanosensitive channel
MLVTTRAAATDCRRPHSARLAHVVSVGLLLCLPGIVRADGASTTPLHKGAEVKIHDTLVFKLWVDRKQETAAARARNASHTLEHALDVGRGEVRVEAQHDTRVIFVADMPVVELYAEDAAVAGTASLDVYAAKLASRVRETLAAEKKRSDIASTVFSISLLVFFGFIALYVLRKIGELAKRARELVVEHPERITSVRLSSIEVVGAGPLRASLLVAVILGRWVLQVGVVYVWLLLSLSRFEVTRPYTARLTNSLLGPLSSLAQRILGAVPVTVLLLVLAISVYVVMRFVELFFAGVSRGQERASWLPRDLVTPTSLLLRVAVVLLALIFAGPAVTGEPESVLGRLGTMVLLALALATTPLLCAGVLGVVTIFSRRVRAGRQIEMAGRTGRVVSVGLLDVLLRDADGCDVRVPHWCSLTRPMRLYAGEPRLCVELCVDAAASPSGTQQLLLEAARGLDEHARVELLDIDADGARYLVSALADSSRASELRTLLAETLRRENIGWGRPRAGARIT